MYTEEEKILIIKDTIGFCRQAIVKAIREEQYKEENCECGLTDNDTWSEEVFDRFGCTCEEDKQ